MIVARPATRHPPPGPLSGTQRPTTPDPPVRNGFITGLAARSTFLKDLSPRHLEFLSWMAKGYNHHTIADVLCLEPKTIERHINGIYNQRGTTPDSKHARVHAVTLYLRATGALPAEDFAEAS